MGANIKKDMKHHLGQFFYFFIFSLMFSCGGADMMSRIDGAQVVRGLAQAESQDFVTKVEVEPSKKMSITILNKSTSVQTVGMIVPDMEVTKEGSVIWSTDNLVRMQSIYELELNPKSEGKIMELPLDFESSDRGTYRLEMTRVVSNPHSLPVPQSVEFEIR